MHVFRPVTEDLKCNKIAAENSPAEFESLSAITTEHKIEIQVRRNLRVIENVVLLL